MSHRRTARHRLLTGLIAGPLALSLVACGSDDDNEASGDDVALTPAAPSSSATDAAPSIPAETPAGSAPAAATGDDSALLAAAQTALASVPASTLFSIDQGSGGWEVSLVSQDGTENDVDVSTDGASITRSPVVDTDDADDTNDQAERVRLLQAPLDHVAAIEAARGAVAGSSVSGADLEEENGVPQWDVQLDEDTATEQTVTIDAASGAVLRIEQDD